MHKICQVIHTDTYDTYIFVYVSLYLIRMCIYLHVSAKIHTRYITNKSQTNQCTSARIENVLSVCICVRCKHAIRQQITHSFIPICHRCQRCVWMIKSSNMTCCLNAPPPLGSRWWSGPCVDVVQQADWSGSSASVADAPWKAGVLRMGHAASAGDCAEFTMAPARRSRSRMCESRTIMMHTTGSVEGM